VLEPAHLLALAERRVAGEIRGFLRARIEHLAEAVQADAGHENRRDRNQRHRVAARREPQAQHRALVAAEQLVDTPQRHRVDVPQFAGVVGDRFEAAIVRRVEAVIHAGGQPQRRIATVPVQVDEVRVAEQVRQGIGPVLHLQQFVAGDGAASADDGVARADENIRIGVDRPGAVAQRTGEAVVQARELLFLRVAEVDVGEEAPGRDRDVAHHGLLDVREPAHEPGRETLGNPVGQEEVQILLLRQTVDDGAHCHGSVNLGG